jgi:hypothetical protein
MEDADGSWTSLFTAMGSSSFWTSAAHSTFMVSVFCHY